MAAPAPAPAPEAESESDEMMAGLESQLSDLGVRSQSSRYRQNLLKSQTRQSFLCTGAGIAGIRTREGPVNNDFYSSINSNSANPGCDGLNAGINPYQGGNPQDIMTFSNTNNEIENYTKTLNKLQNRVSLSCSSDGFNRNAVDLEQDDLHDSTYEDKTSSIETEEFTEGCSMEQEETVDMCIPAQDVLFRAVDVLLDDGASDYCPSDDGQGPDDESTLSLHQSQPDKVKSRDAAIQKYLQRARCMLQCRIQNRYFGLPENTVHWVCRFARFSSTEKRWVDKGPIMVHFMNHPTESLPIRLIGTRSVCIDLQLFQHMDSFWKRLPGNRLFLTSAGHNSIIHADIITRKMSPLIEGSIPLFECRSVLTARQEPLCTVFALKFITEQDLNHFGQTTLGHLEKVKHIELEKRICSFIESVPIHASGRFGSTRKVSHYSTHQQFVQEMATRGLEYHPVYSRSGAGFDEKVKCTGCGVVLGPFADVVNVSEMHRVAHSHALAGNDPENPPNLVRSLCPFL